VYLDDCQGWRSLGDVTTDADGRTALDANLGLPAGVYQVWQEMLGDTSVVQSLVWVLPEGTRLTVTDVDGTLTTSDGELVVDLISDFFAPIGRDEYVPLAYPGAVDLTNAHASIGHVVLYLTGRPYWLTESTRTWLRELGFASGPLHTTDSNEQALPSESAVGVFKRDFLLGLVASGFVLDVGYGNATTDIFAYTGAGMAADELWIIGGNGGAQGTQKAEGSWEARAAEVAALPAVTQPWQ
jgi:phosphatidate phosphatase PAH1